MHVYMTAMKMVAISRPPPAALGQPEVPAGEVARDHIGDAEAREQHPARRPRAQLALVEIALVRALVARSVDLTPLGRHLSPLFLPPLEEAPTWPGGSVTRRAVGMSKERWTSARVRLPFAPGEGQQLPWWATVALGL
jgi:hypothetical protein